MSKFPILTLYRKLFKVGAIVVVIAGIISAISDASQVEGQLEFAQLVAGFIPFLIVATVLVFLAEVIKLALNIESHLEKIADRYQ